MDKNFKITPQNQPEKNIEVYSSKMRMAIQDYCNDFVGLNMHYNLGGIKQVRDIVKEKDSHVKTFEEYLNIDSSVSLTNEEATNPVLKQKAQLLNIFAEKLNKHIDTMTAAEFEEEMKQVIDICRF
jgi:hypothetical protein